MAKFTNSSLATYVRISPFKNVNRYDETTGVYHTIKKITWHHMAGVATCEQFGNIVTRPDRNMSATYCVDKNARVGRFLDESDRPWTSSSRANDFQAVTIEISNSKTGGDWPISDKVLEKSIELTVDICKRNGIKELVYTGDSRGNFTFHKMFAATACPGPYIERRANEIVSRINAKLKGVEESVHPTPTPSTTTPKIEKGSLVSIASNAVYYTGGSIPSWVKQEKWYIASISGDRAVLGLNERKDRNIQSPINTKYLTLVSGVFKEYTVSIAASEKLYKDPTNTSTNVSTVGKSGVYTIIGELSINGVKYGKLKSGAGYVNLDSVNGTKKTTDTTIRVGDKVKVLNNVQYNGKTFKVYNSSYTVLEVKGDRVVISSDGKNVTCAINSKNIRKI